MSVHYYAVFILLLHHGCIHSYYRCIPHPCPPKPPEWNMNHDGTTDGYIITPTSVCNIRWSPQLRLCKCGLTAVSEDAFTCMFILQRLDLRKNKLQHIPRRTLHPLTSLLTLILAGISHNISYNFVIQLMAYLFTSVANWCSENFEPAMVLIACS